MSGVWPYREHAPHVESLLPGPAANGDGLGYMVGATAGLYEIDDGLASIYEGSINLGLAAGYTLDLLGDRVRERRDGLDNHEYRRIIAGRRIARARRGAVTYPRVWAGWCALTGSTQGRMITLPPASVFLWSATDWVPSDTFLLRAGAVVDALMGAGYEADAVIAPPGTLYVDDLPGVDDGLVGYQLRTGRYRASTS